MALDDALALLHGAGVTLALIALATLIGGALAIAAALLSRSRRAGLRSMGRIYVEAIRNTPFIVQLFVVYFGLPSLGLRLAPFPAAVLAMSVNLSAYAAEMVRAGLDSVPSGQVEAARALGLRPVRLFRSVVLPQALAAVFPALVSQVVITMLESAVVSQIALTDLTYEADMIQARSFEAFRTYAVVTVVYLLLSLGLRRALGWSGGALTRRTAR